MFKNLLAGSLPCPANSSAETEKPRQGRAPLPSSSVLTRPSPNSPPTASSHEDETMRPLPQTPCLHPGGDSGPGGLAWGQVSPQLGIMLRGLPATQGLTLGRDLSRTTSLCEPRLLPAPLLSRVLSGMNEPHTRRQLQCEWGKPRCQSNLSSSPSSTS